MTQAMSVRSAASSAAANPPATDPNNRARATGKCGSAAASAITKIVPPSAALARQITFLPSPDRRAGTADCALVSPLGMSAVMMSRSLYVRDTRTLLIRRSSSSLVIRSWTNATLSTSITCSRSADDARRGAWRFAPAAVSSPGLTITGTSARAPPTRSIPPGSTAAVRQRMTAAFKAIPAQIPRLISRMIAERPRKMCGQIRPHRRCRHRLPGDGSGACTAR